VFEFYFLKFCIFAIVSNCVLYDDTDNLSKILYTIEDVSPLLINNNDVVTVRYSALKPGILDWIGAFSPSNADTTVTSPVKFAWCTESPNYFSKRHGSITFNFTNLRADIAFYYFINGTTDSILVASYPLKVDFKDYNQPLRARVVPTGDYDKFLLLWSSAYSIYPIVKWGTTSGNYDRVVNATTKKLLKSDLCGEPANSIGFRDLGLIHTASFFGSF